MFWEAITWLPEGLTVKGDLNLGCCWFLKSLPAKLTVEGDLSIVVTQIRVLPADLNVRGKIYANNLDPNIPEGFLFNDDLFLGGKISMQYPLETPLNLPDMTVNGDLDVSKRVIKDWSKKLIVKGRLIADNISGIIISGLD